MERMSVAMVVEQCWQPVPGGSATYIVELGKALAHRSDVRLLGVAASHRDLPVPQLRPPMPVRYLGLPRQALYWTWRSWRQPPMIRRNTVDVLHATTWAVPPKTAPLAVTVHDVAFLRQPEHFTPRGRTFFRRMFDITANEADAIIVPSRATARDCVEAGIDDDRIKVIPHGARIESVDPNAVRTFRARHGLDRDYLLWCGTLEPRKNVPALLDAFAQAASSVPELDLVLVGPQGWGTTQEDVNGAVERLGPRAHVIGRLEQDELAAAYRGARAFCFPSTWEGFGLPVLEAMAHGVPVITSAGTSMAEIIEVDDGTVAGILIDPTDADAMAQAIVAASTTRHDELADAALRRAADFSWPRCAAEHVEAYRAIAGARP